MALTTNEFLNGITGLIYAIIVIYVGLRIASKYFKYKQKTLLYIGIGWLGFPTPYYAVSLSFLSVLITGEPINDFLYFLIAVGLVPIFLLLWMAGFTELLYKNRQKLILIIYAIFGGIFESIILYALFTDLTIIGIKEGPVDTDWSTVIVIYFIPLMLTIIITGFLLSSESLKSDNPEIKLKGKFLLIAFILFIIGEILDLIFDIPITRLTLMISSIAFYFGWIMPEKMKQLLVRQD
ncbi:MAG: hypothetical protein ACFFCM_07570 [Promethearchaeota archaeon]